MARSSSDPRQRRSTARPDREQEYGDDVAACLLRGVRWPPDELTRIGAEHGGQIVLDERLNDYLELALRQAKARRPNVSIQTMRHPQFPAEEFVPVEITIDPFRLGRQFRSGYHLFVKRKRLL